jgi:very-short-patch-repair endonuclease
MAQKRFSNLAQLKERRRSLRSNMPRAEILIWSKLKNKQLGGLKFRRQHSMGPYILDFYCPAFRFAIEIDGDTHAGEEEERKDRIRQRYIESLGVQFIRFSNSEVIENIEGVLEKILSILPPLTPPSQEGNADAD